jgi:xylose isomerase
MIFDAATSIGFLQKYGLQDDFKLNIEVNHATLAQHTFEHELTVAANDNMLGSIDANRGDYQNGWDTDQFPNNIEGNGSSYDGFSQSRWFTRWWC